MTHSIAYRAATLLALLCLMLAVPFAATAQTTPDEDETPSAPPPKRLSALHTSLGVQTMWFNGDYPASAEISPGTAGDLSLGGGIKGPSNGIRLGLEIFPQPGGAISFPMALEAYFLSGKTTYPLTALTERPTKLLTLTHSANIFSAEAGVSLTVLRFKYQQLYLSALATANYIPSTSLTARQYYLQTDETLVEHKVVPDSSSHTRFGAYLKFGVRAEFFDPLMLDFSIGYGGLNLLNRNKNLATSRNLLVVEPNNAPEAVLGYIGVGFSIIWRL
ncbi:MAG TPA: hypothetical protein VHI13_16195 [Candidatus Kapabacteria bacterium]|nr:hypothetical protein [Candidatus Kapabacteria bacterium]